MPNVLPLDGLFPRTLLSALAAAAIVASAPAAEPPSVQQSAGEPLRYVGDRQPVKEYHHGLLPHGIGVHRHQAFRANRSRPPEGGVVGATYNHAPMLAYWQGRFWLQWLDNEVEEHNPPGRTMIAVSRDGHEWSPPRIAFPEVALPEIKPPADIFPGRDPLSAGTSAIYHQRMGFYVAPNGRLLTSAFISYSLTPRDGPNKGQGLGRLVREVKPDGAMGPIYFVRYNRAVGWNEENTAFAFPFYRASHDAGFIEACEALLADKLVTLQWMEEDMQRDGFFTIEPNPKLDLKAFTYFERPDGVLVGMWKGSMTALSADRGASWTDPVESPTLRTVGAKLWGQRTDDGRYALVYNHSASGRNRFPLVVMTGEDGHTFDDMLVVHGDVAPARYHGMHKSHGPQYVRGIFPGNGNPPGDELWLTYSMNKEDIWVTSVRTPVSGTAKRPVREDFQNASSPAQLHRWNLYVPQWAPIRIATDPKQPRNRALQLVDEEPWDYALAEVHFPAAKQVAVEFRVHQTQVGQALLNVEVQDPSGRRPVHLRFDPEWLSFDIARIQEPAVPMDTGHWHHVRLQIDCTRSRYDVYLDGSLAREGIEFAAEVETLQRLVFRTGPWRHDVRAMTVNGEPSNPGMYLEDLAGADAPAARSAFLIDDVEAGPRR